MNSDGVANQDNLISSAGFYKAFPPTVSISSEVSIGP